MREMLQVQHLPVLSPAGQVLIQQPGEAVGVVSLQQMGQLVGYDVLHTLHRLLSQFQVEPLMLMLTRPHGQVFA